MFHKECEPSAALVNEFLFNWSPVRCFYHFNCIYYEFLVTIIHYYYYYYPLHGGG